MAELSYPMGMTTMVAPALSIESPVLPRLTALYHFELSSAALLRGLACKMARVALAAQSLLVEFTAITFVNSPTSRRRLSLYPSCGGEAIELSCRNGHRAAQSQAFSLQS